VDLPDPHPGPGRVRIAVRAAGVNPSDWKKRKGLMDGELPQTVGHEAAGVVDELGEGLVERVRALAPDGTDAALDVAGSGVLPELIELAGGPEHVVTVADFGGAQEHGVTFSSGDAGRAVHAIAEIGELIESGRFLLPVAQTFPLAEIAEVHRVSEDGHVRGKLVLVVGSPICGSR
jgi:NADPH:quinone reductase-like Zn-dependent oxidoreductase